MNVDYTDLQNALSHDLDLIEKMLAATGWDNGYKRHFTDFLTIVDCHVVQTIKIGLTVKRIITNANKWRYNYMV